VRIIVWRAGWGLPGNRPARIPWVSPSLGALATPTPYSPRVERRDSTVELATGVHLPVEGWTDARIGQSLKINISLTIAKT